MDLMLRAVGVLEGADEEVDGGEGELRLSELEGVAVCVECNV